MIYVYIRPLLLPLLPLYPLPLILNSLLAFVVRFILILPHLRLPYHLLCLPIPLSEILPLPLLISSLITSLSQLHLHPNYNHRTYQATIILKYPIQKRQSTLTRLIYQILNLSLKLICHLTDLCLIQFHKHLPPLIINPSPPLHHPLS